MSEFDVFDEPFRSSVALNTLSQIKKFRKNDVLIHQDDNDDKVYLILKGEVKVSNYALTGQEVWHTSIKAGHFFGEMAAISGQERSANVTAITNTKVAILTKMNFLQVLREDPDISLWVMRELVRRLSDTTTQAYNHVTKTVSERVHLELLGLCSSKPKSNGHYEIRPKPVLAQIARRINTDRETVSREVSKLVQAGIITRHAGFYEVLDRNRLAV